MGTGAESCFARYNSGKAECAQLNGMSEAYHNDHTSLQIHTRGTERSLPHRDGSGKGWLADLCVKPAQAQSVSDG